MDNRTVDDILNENQRLHRQITANNVELQKRRWQSTGAQPLRIEDFVGKRVSVTSAFEDWLDRNNRVPYRETDEFKVQHVNATETGWVVDLVTCGDSVVRGVPFDIAQEMRREYMRVHREG